MGKLDKNKYLGGVYGLAVADAYGVPFEFKRKDEVAKADLSVMNSYGTYKQPAGTFSDDTSMVLATMDAMSCNVPSLEGIMQAFVKWLHDGKYTPFGNVFDVGNTTYKAVLNYIMGESVENCGVDSFSANGNGSMMRMLPLIYTLWLEGGIEINDKRVNRIYELAGLTHAHILSKICCVYYVYCGIYLLDAPKEDADVKGTLMYAIRAVERYYRVKDIYPMAELMIKGDSLLEALEWAEEDISSSGFAKDTLIASLWSLCKGNSYQEAVAKAVSLGGDTDTIGAITGSLAGICYGYKNIPQKWLKELKNKPLIEDICKRFYEKCR